MYMTFINNSSTRLLSRRCASSTISFLSGRSFTSKSRQLLLHRHCRCCFHGSSSSSSTLAGGRDAGVAVLKDILERVSRGEMDTETALTRMQHAENVNNDDNNNNKNDSNNDSDDMLQLQQSFANLDYQRSERTGFPEAIFAQGKTSQQVATLLDSMAQNFAIQWQQQQALQQQQQQKNSENHDYFDVPTAILATRVTPCMFHDLSKMVIQHGELEYHETARIVSMKPHGISSTMADVQDTSSRIQRHRRRRVVVATAGTTDIPVAEEAAIVLEATGSIEVDRIYDAGVAGLHRIVQALPRLRHENVGAIVVCAGMDGALPSVVGGLVAVPVIAVPTSIGYGASFGGVSALLTMLNSCAPGVGVVNIDNGFGAAVLAFKCLGGTSRGKRR